MIVVRSRLVVGLKACPALFCKTGTFPFVRKICLTTPFRQFMASLSSKDQIKPSAHYNFEHEDEGVDIENDVVDETIGTSSQIELFSNWKNPHSEFVEDTLTKIELNKINDSTICAFCHDIVVKTEEEIVQFFAYASVFYNDTDKNLVEDPDIKTLINAVNERAKTLSYDNLILCVKALNSWPEAIRTTKLLYRVPSDHHHHIRLLYDCLRDESIRRLSATRTSPELYISVVASEMAKAFQLAHAWLPIDRMRKGWCMSYPVEVINKIADRERGSMRRIKRMNKDLFVDFMRICKEVQDLRAYFHKYYCTVKFVDFLPNMNEDEMSTVCQAFTTCNLVGNVTHPMELKLKSSLLKFVRDNIHTIKSQNLNSIMAHVSANAIPGDLHQDILHLQKVMVDDEITVKMDIRTLIRVAGMGIREKVFARDGIYPLFMDKVVVSILAFDRTSSRWHIEGCHFKTMAAMTALHCDTPTARKACQELQRNVLEFRKVRQPLQIAQGILHMAHLGLYDVDALDCLFSSDKISKVVGEERRVLRTVKFSEKGGICSLGPVLMCLQGMVELECPDYKGALITGELDLLKKHYMHSATPVEVFENGPSKLLSRFWVLNGLLVYHLLCNLMGGARYVSESYVLPFTTQINYVILLNEHGRPSEVPDWFRSLPETQTKVVKDGHWVMFTLLHPHEDAVQTLTGGRAVTDRLARTVGFTNVTVNLQALENKTEGEMMEYLREQLRINCPIYKSSLTTCEST